MWLLNSQSLEALCHSNVYWIPHKFIIMRGLSAKYFELNGNVYTQNGWNHGLWRERGEAMMWRNLKTKTWAGDGCMGRS